MAQNSFFPSTLFARLISVHPDKQDINFPCETNEDQTNAEWRIYQSLNGEIFLKNISAPNLQVDDGLLEIGREKRLFGGERMSFGQDSGLKFDYVFCCLNFQSDLKRERDDEIIDSEKMKKLVKNDLLKEFTCSICTNFFHKCMVLVPCQHSFCNFCLFDQLKVSSQCLLCTVEAVSVAKNPVLSNVIQFVKHNFLIQQRSQERKELEEINFGGAIVRNSNSVYIGSYVNGKRDGQGKIIEKSGAIYEGNWKNNKRKGKGVIIFASGDRYDGFWMKDKKHRAGKYIWSSGKEYEGNFQDDLLTGYGAIKYEDGKIYQGQWKNNTREGHGILTLSNGDKYEGKWVNDVLQSEVKIEYSNGEKYEGEINVENLQRQGKGILIISNGDKYEGTWVSNILQPEVIIQYSNGEKYEGRIKVENLQRHGKGVLTYKNGDQYDGNWANDKEHGKGREKFRDGTRVFEGVWKEGRMSGKVCMTDDVNGTKYQAEWKVKKGVKEGCR